MRWMSCFFVSIALVACGPSAGGAPRHSGPDVVTAEWTSGDDAVLEGADAGVAPQAPR